MINLSCRIADTVGFAVFPGCETLSYEDLLDELPARERKVFQTNGADLGLEIASNINAIERA